MGLYGSMNSRPSREFFRRTKILFSLIKSQLNVHFGLSHARHYYLRKRQRLWEPVIILLSIGSFVVFLSTGVYKAASYIFSATSMLGQGSVTLTLGFLSSQTIMLLLGFTLVISVFYFSNDLDTLIPLPLKPWEVLAAKFSVILAGEYILLAVFVIPVIAAYAQGAGGGLWYWVSATLLFLTLPMVPLVVAALPAILLMRVANVSKRKDTLVMIGGFLLIAATIAFQFLVQKGPGKGEEIAFLEAILSKANGLASAIGNRFPPSLWATLALSEAGTGQGLAYLGLFIVASAVSLIGLFAIGNKVFYEGLVAGFEVGMKRRMPQLPSREKRVGRWTRKWFRLLPGVYIERSPMVSIALAEAKLFVRTPVFVLNGFTGFVMFPAMFIMLTITGGSDIKVFLDLLSSSPSLRLVGIIVVSIYILLLASMSSIPVTPFSREGRANIWVLKSMPATGKMVGFAKALAAQGMITLGSVPGVAVLSYLLGLPLLYVVLGLCIGILMSFSFCLLSVMLDMWRPMLTWTDKVKSVKSNTNTILGMVLGIVVGGVLALIIYGAFAVGISGPWMVGLAIVFAGVLLYISLAAFKKLADRLWADLEA